MRQSDPVTRLSLLAALCCAITPLWAPNQLEGQISVDPLNVTVGIQGQVTVKRKGWTGFAPVVFGTSLQIGDLVTMGESSHAKVVCGDLSLRDIQPGISAVPCPVPRALLHLPNKTLINATRSWPSDGSFPVVVAPRKTRLMSDHPILKWTPVNGATRYLVTVRGDDFYWQTVVSGTELAYPASAPRLQPGHPYKLIVQTNDHSSSDEPGLGLGFSLLTSTERKTIQQNQQQLQGLGLPDGPTQYLIAHLYAGNDLNAEGIDLLERVAPQFKVAAVERSLGDLYMKISLPRQAEAHYLKSLALSAAEQDADGEMLERHALAYIYGEILGNQKLAGEQLQAMLDLARKLGDDETATQVHKDLMRAAGAGT